MVLPSLKLTASLHLKMDGWKTILSFWGPVQPGMGELLVPGSVPGFFGGTLTMEKKEKKLKGIFWIYPPPSNSGKWRFIGIPY